MDVSYIRLYILEDKLSSQLKILISYVHNQVKLPFRDIANRLGSQTRQRSITVQHPVSIGRLIDVRHGELIGGDCQVDLHISAVQRFTMVKPIQRLVGQLFSPCCCNTVSEDNRITIHSFHISRIIGQDEGQYKFSSQVHELELNRSVWIWLKFQGFWDQCFISPLEDVGAFIEDREMDGFAHEFDWFDHWNLWEFVQFLNSQRNLFLNVGVRAFQRLHRHKFLFFSTIHLLHFVADYCVHNRCHNSCDRIVRFPAWLRVVYRLDYIEANRTFIHPIADCVVIENIQVVSICPGEQVKHWRILWICLRDDDSSDQGQTAEGSIVGEHHEVEDVQFPSRRRRNDSP